MASIERELVLCNISMSTVPFREFVQAAGRAGFGAISVTPRTHRRALKYEGLDAAEMRRVLDDAGIRVTEMEGCGDWLAPPPPPSAKFLAPVYTSEQTLDAAVALAAPVVTAVHMGPLGDLGLAADRFAALCERAADRSLMVALEPMAFAELADVATAWEIITRSGAANAGLLLDSWHHRRTADDDAILDGIPPSRILSVQLADGANPPAPSLLEDVTRRRLPGTGDLRIADLVRTLDARGIDAPIGVEVYSESLLAQGADAAARALAAALRSVLRAAAGP